MINNIIIIDLRQKEGKLTEGGKIKKQKKIYR